MTTQIQSDNYINFKKEMELYWSSQKLDQFSDEEVQLFIRECDRTFTLIKNKKRLSDNILYVSALACCGEKLNELEEYYKNIDITSHIENASTKDWGEQILASLFHAWINIFRGQVNIAIHLDVLNNYRKQQKKHEKTYLVGQNQKQKALRLICYYQWITATENFIKYSWGQLEFRDKIIPHFEQAEKACPDMEIIQSLNWLHIYAKLQLRINS